MFSAGVCSILFGGEDESMPHQTNILRLVTPGGFERLAYLAGYYYRSGQKQYAAPESHLLLFRKPV